MSSNKKINQLLRYKTARVRSYCIGRYSQSKKIKLIVGFGARTLMGMWKMIHWVRFGIKNFKLEKKNV